MILYPQNTNVLLLCMAFVAVVEFLRIFVGALLRFVFLSFSWSVYC